MIFKATVPSIVETVYQKIISQRVFLGQNKPYAKSHNRLIRLIPGFFLICLNIFFSAAKVFAEIQRFHGYLQRRLFRFSWKRKSECGFPRNPRMVSNF